jgi:hypothetical protein
METVSFNTLKIEVLDSYFPEEILKHPTIISDILWLFDFFYNVNVIAEEITEIAFDIQYKMYLKGDPQQKTIFLIKTRSHFKVEGKLSFAAKIAIFYKLATAAMLNCQGIYASKVDGTKYNAQIPPEAGIEQFHDSIKNRIKNEWK